MGNDRGARFLIGLAFGGVLLASAAVSALGLPGMPRGAQWVPIGQVSEEPSENGAPNRALEQGRHAIHAAVEAGETERLVALLAAGADANALDENGCTALHCASMGNELDCVTSLLQRGARTDIRDDDGYTALDRAMEFGYADIVEAFLAAGADRETRDRFGRTLLIRAAENDFATCVTGLLAKGASVAAVDGRGDTALHKAAWLADPGIASAVLAAGAEVNAVNTAGFTPLHHALMGQRAKTAEALIVAGADVSAKSALGVSVLHVAVQKGDAALVEMLLRRGAPANACTPNGDSPLCIALQDGKPELVKLLCDHGAELFSEDLRAWRRMMEAFKKAPKETRDLVRLPDCRELARREDSTEMLLKALQAGAALVADGLVTEGTDIAIEDADGNSALHLAARLGDSTLCERILAKGAEVISYNSIGETPITLAVRSNDCQTVKLLVNRGADIFAGDSRSWLRALDALATCSPEAALLVPDWSLHDLARKKDAEGLTVLYAATREGMGNLVTLLLSVGADPNVADAAGMTPLHWAMRERDAQMAKPLLASGANLSLKNEKGATPLDEALSAGFDLEELRATFVAEGNDHMAAGDMVDAHLAYGAALRLEDGPSLRSVAAQSLALALVWEDRTTAASCLERLAQRRVAGEGAHRVVLAVAEYHMKWDREDQALETLAPLVEKKTRFGFAARIMRSICLARKDDRDGATAELQAVAEDLKAGDMGVLARCFLEQGFGGIAERRDLLAALDEVTKRGD